ncbi:hypothetical protein C2845_PM02G26600 [Panicum miliaceum]|uniref:Phylloplanin-like n=1 Tax=Panicum miliaceum TaxID=4540 RepID=A0A3L6SFG4_PANMI|nr:hypothetical protein C2845_PM02G26600 [Panicum miliaceum]
MAPKSLVLLAALLLIAAVGQCRARDGSSIDAAAVLPFAGKDLLLLRLLLGRPILVLMFSLLLCLSGHYIRPDATVQAVCDNNVVGTATTDAAGAFTINLGPVTTALVAPVLYPVLRNQCSVAVTTPLATCNASLGSGTLTAPLQFLQARRPIITDGIFDFLRDLDLPVAGEPVLTIVPGTFSSSA